MPRKRMSKSVKKRIQRDNAWYETGIGDSAAKAAKIPRAKIARPKLPKVRNGGG